jgi:hypothetical protein
VTAEACGPVLVLFAVKEKMVKRKACLQSATMAVPGTVVARVDPQVEVPATLVAVGGDLVDSRDGRLCAFLGRQHALLLFQLQVMATVAIRDGGLRGGTRIVVRRRSCEQVPLCGVFVAGVVCEQVM